MFGKISVIISKTVQDRDIYLQWKTNRTRKVVIITMYCHLRPPDAIAFST